MFAHTKCLSSGERADGTGVHFGPSQGAERSLVEMRQLIGFGLFPRAEPNPEAETSASAEVLSFPCKLSTPCLKCLESEVFQVFKFLDFGIFAYIMKCLGNGTQV